MSNGRIEVPAFGTRPFVASAIIALGVFVIRGVLVKDEQKLEKSILIALISFIIWNPIFAFRQGVGIGYLLYLVAIITLGVVYIKRREGKKIVESQPVKQEETTKPEESVKEAETVTVEEQSVKDEHSVDKEELQPEVTIQEEKTVVEEQPAKDEGIVNEETSKSEEEDSEKK